jgi:hypothetical protein
VEEESEVEVVALDFVASKSGLAILSPVFSVQPS